MREIVMVPQESISWLVDQKDSVLSVKEIRKKNLAIDWLLPTIMDPLHDLFMFDVVRRDLPRNLGLLQPAILHEMHCAIESIMGLNAEGWDEVCLFTTMQTIIKKISNRVLFSRHLCEDTRFLKSMERFSGWLGTGAFVAGQLVPWPLRPWLGSLVAIPVYYHMTRSLKCLLPTVKDRMDDIKRIRAASSYPYAEHNDFMAWYIAAVLDADIQESVKTPEAIAQRALLLVSLNILHSEQLPNKSAI